MQRVLNMKMAVVLFFALTLSVVTPTPSQADIITVINNSDTTYDVWFPIRALGLSVAGEICADGGKTESVDDPMGRVLEAIRVYKRVSTTCSSKRTMADPLVARKVIDMTHRKYTVTISKSGNVNIQEN